MFLFFVLLFCCFVVVVVVVVVVLFCLQCLPAFWCSVTRVNGVLAVVLKFCKCVVCNSFFALIFCPRFVCD